MVKSYKKYNRTPNQGEIVAHAPLLDYELEKINPKLIVTLGNIGLQRLTGKIKITDVHGQLLKQPIQKLKDMQSAEFIWSENEYHVFPTFHPASIFIIGVYWSLFMRIWRSLKDLY